MASGPAVVPAIGEADRSVNITSIIQEIPGRAGWASGNNIALIGDANAGVDLHLISYDTGGNVWYVEVDYTSGTSGAGASTLGAVTGSAAAVLPGHGTASSTLGKFSEDIINEVMEPVACSFS